MARRKSDQCDIRTECAVNFQKFFDKLERLDKAICGDNGVISMLKDHAEKIENHEKYINQKKGGNKVIMYIIGSGWFTTIVLGFLQYSK